MTNCPKCHDILPIDARACACGWRKDGGKSDSKGPDLYCPWNDYGRVCGVKGSMSDSITGGGPWYCSEHYWKLKGRVLPGAWSGKATTREPAAEDGELV